MVKLGTILIAALAIILGACSINSPSTYGRDAKTPDLGNASEAIVQLGNPLLPAAKPGEMVTVEIDTFRVFNDTVSLKDAETQTRNFIRELALARALPADVSLTSMTSTIYVERNSRFDESLAKGIFMMSSSAGRIVKEEYLKREPSFEEKSHSLKYRMLYRAQIMPQERVYNPAMSLQVKLSDTLLKDGDIFELAITPNTDGYLYFFDFLSDNSVMLVFPSNDIRDNRITAGQNWSQKVGVRCDPLKEITIETLYFVFSMDPIAGWDSFRSSSGADDLVFSAGEESFVLFQNWLAKSDPKRRVERLAQIHIIK